MKYLGLILLSDSCCNNSEPWLLSDIRPRGEALVLRGEVGGSMGPAQEKMEKKSDLVQPRVAQEFFFPLR